MELLENIKTLTNKTDDRLISLILFKTKLEIENYIDKEYVDKYDNLLIDMVVFKLNRLGTEGLVSQSYSGVSESYLDDYPKYIINQLEKIKKGKGWGML